MPAHCYRNALYVSIWIMAVALIHVILSGSCSAVRAELRVCNKTSSKVGVAIGHKKTDRFWTTEGWWNLQPGACKFVVRGPLVARYYYVYALDYGNGGEWSGSSYMCVHKNTFTINGIKNCIKRGYERAGFSEIDTGTKRSWTLNLVAESK